MVIYEFGVQDLARTHFAISPLFELTQSLRAMVEPSRSAFHLPWIEGLRGRLGGLDLLPAIELVPPRGYTPDFIAPPPSTPLAEIGDELEAMRRTSPARVRMEVGIRFRGRRVPASVQPLLDHPRRELGRLCDTFAEYWDRAIEPHWPRIKALLRADVEYHSRRLADGGADELFADLHHMVVWHGSELSVDSQYSVRAPLGGQGLLLVPSAFTWQRPMTITDAPWQPTLVYPARAVATLWESAPTSPQALAALLGGTRAAVLTALEAPRSTTELARRLGVSAGGVSQHLGVLRGAGLVTTQRAGRSVLYVRTPLADGLVRGRSAPGTVGS
jgi:biotin operon repressor